MTGATTAPRTCPSARCAPGNRLLGVIGADGRMRALRTPLPVDDAFAAEAARAGRPEARMRFAGTCVEAGCAQWTGAGCGVIERVLDLLAPDAPAALPPCAIRGQCRWFGQRGGQACAACADVVTDRRPQTEAPDPIAAG